MDVTLLLVGLILARTAGVTLLWISRPAAQVDLPSLTSRRAVVEISAGLLVSAYAPVFLFTTLASVRVVMLLSYRAWGGIRNASLTWVYALTGAIALSIASLPAASRLLFSR